MRLAILRISVAASLTLVCAAANADNAIQIENKKAVDPVKDSWLPTIDPTSGQAINLGINGTIDVYPSAWSVKNGDTVGIRVSTIASKFRTRVYRLGWYANSPGGATVGSRLVSEVLSTPGVKQAFPAEDIKTGIAEAKWSDSVSLVIPSDWVTGHYVIRVTTDTGKDAFSYFILRDDTAAKKAPLLYVDALMTNAAYNAWPRLKDSSGKFIAGKSAYAYNSAGSDVQASGEQRAVEVSLDRPQGENWGLGLWWDWSVPTVQWLEQRGYDVAYADSVDLHTGNVLASRAAWMDSGHDEYWTMGMWDSLQSARDKGLNLAWFSGNDLLWQVRLKPGSGGPLSTVVVFKDASYPNSPVCGTCSAYGGDPEYQLALAAKKAGDTSAQVAHLKNVTYAWTSLSDWDPVAEKPIPAPSPVNRYGMGLEGLINGPATPDCTPTSKPGDTCYGISWVVESADHWVYTGAGVKGGVATGLADGNVIPHIVGYEMDNAAEGFTYPQRPVGQLVLASTNNPFYTGAFNAQYYVHSSGAKVFSAGTINWSWGLDRKDLGDWGTWAQSSPVTTKINVAQAVTGVTVNVLNRFLDVTTTGGDAGPDAGPEAGPDADAAPDTSPPDVKGETASDAADVGDSKTPVDANDSAVAKDGDTSEASTDGGGADVTDDATADVVADSVNVDEAGGGDATSADATNGDATAIPNDIAKSGCGCEMPGSVPVDAKGIVALGALAAVVARARKKRLLG
ncbi:MAG: hypothetical protein NVSMB1_15660 [Polyangiales bacterium]